MDKTKKELFLTFDDGPVPGPTHFVLDTLKVFSIQATFFCIGDNIQKYPDLFQRIWTEGHGVANHTFHHLNGWRTTKDIYLEDIERCEQEIEKYKPGITDQKLFRPPYGRLTRRVIPYLKDYHIIMWDVLTLDYNTRQSPDSCFRSSKKVIRPGSIIVFHDSLKAEGNLRYTLPKLIEYGLEQGYTFKPIIL